jgi:predicted PurR-regulated permease PerM
MAWVASTIIGIAAVAVAAAGVSYQAYSAANPPKTPKQATQALNENQKSLQKLQAKLATAQASGKNTSTIQKGIDKVQNAISFLTNWITNYGNTKAPKIASATGGTPVASPVTGAIANHPGQTNWPLMIGGGALVVGAGYVVLKVVKKKKGK